MKKKSMRCLFTQFQPRHKTYQETLSPFRRGVNLPYMRDKSTKNTENSHLSPKNGGHILGIALTHFGVTGSLKTFPVWQSRILGCFTR